MPITKNIKHIFEPTPLQCGQAVLAMISNKTVNEIIKECGTDKETTFKQMVSVLNANHIKLSTPKTEFCNISELPNIALLSLETPKCWHWSLYFNGRFYDPEHGLIDNLPISNRKYFWELNDI